MGVDLLAFAYAATVAAGGIMGYVKKGSLVSGVMGAVAGGLLGLGAMRTSRNPNNYRLQLTVAAGLTAFMGYRFMNTGKFMPAGLVAVLSLLMVARYSLRAIGYEVKRDP